MNKVLRYFNKLFDRLLPPIKFKKKYFKKEVVSTEDLDRWAEEYIRKHDAARRKKRG